MSDTERAVTPEVALFAGFSYVGDLIGHGWEKHIGGWFERRGKRQWQAHPIAMRILARVLFFYSPSPVFDEQGSVVGWRRKFAGRYWQLNPRQMARELGCSVGTLWREIDLLRELGLIWTQPARERAAEDGVKAIPLHVVPIKEKVEAITARATAAPVAVERKFEPPTAEQLARMAREKKARDAAAKGVHLGSPVEDSRPVILYRSLTRYSPNEVQKRMLTEKVGEDEAALLKLRAIVEQACAFGCSARNVHQILGWYEDGAVPDYAAERRKEFEKKNGGSANKNQLTITDAEGDVIVFGG